MLYNVIVGLYVLVSRCFHVEYLDKDTSVASPLRHEPKPKPKPDLCIVAWYRLRFGLSRALLAVCLAATYCCTFDV